MTVQSVAFPNGANPQHVLGPPAPSAIFLVLTVRPGSEETTKDFLGDIAGIVRSVGFRAREDHLSCVTGIGAELWDRMFHAPRPAQLHPFIEQRGDVHTAPSTPGDLLFHIRARRQDLCFELARQLIAALGDAVAVVDEVHGFRYFDERDIMGFVDGTENPEDQEAVDSVFLGPEGEEFEGSTYVIVQKYTHDLSAWESLPVEEQEEAFGRHKLSDMEFPDEDKAPNAHLTLNSVESPDGTEHKIVRDNMVFGSVESGEFGTYFIGYAADVSVTEQMLENMFIGKPRGTYDRILDFSTAETGGLFFVPTQDFLDDPGGQLSAADAAVTGDAGPEAAGVAARGGPAAVDPDGDPDAEDGDAGVSGDPAGGPASAGDDASTDEPQADDGSLGIGSLRRRRQ